MKYSLELIGIGLEIVVGKISNDTYNYFAKNNLSIQNYINGLVQIPKKYQPFENDAWFECDNICHLHNVYINKNNKILIKENRFFWAQNGSAYSGLTCRQRVAKVIGTVITQKNAEQASQISSIG